MRVFHLVQVFLIFFSLGLSAQRIDNMASYRSMDTDRYFRFSYDNDYFSATDRNYTQGYNFELVSSGLSKNPINVLFLKTANGPEHYGLSLEHIGFTPRNYEQEGIQLGDRPFASVIMIKSFAMARDTIRKSRIVSSLNLGMMGPGAFGKEMQVGIHEATDNVIPLGWHNQIKTDAVVNYELTYEKQILQLGNLFLLNASGTARLGTMFTNAALSTNAVVGLIDSPYKTKDKRKFKLYGYGNISGTAVEYDATLQGGKFNRTSPYVLRAKEIERFVGQVDYGLVLNTGGLFLEYSRSIISKEFKSGEVAKWGGIKIGFTF